MGELNEKCAVFGVFGKGMDVSRLTFFGLFALQHRGQESSGMAVSDRENIISHKEMGLVSQVYTEEVIEKLKGNISVGHNRYSTSKVSTVSHAQPIISSDRSFALVHNGNLPSVTALHQFLEERGANREEKEDCSDSCLMADAIEWYFNNGLSIEDAVMKSYPLFTGAFSTLVMGKDKLVAIRDSYGIRPLSLGKINGGFVVSSETCAFGPIGATFVREVLPGEMIIIDDEGLRSVQIAASMPKLDIFEFIYFARHDSRIMDRSVYDVRKNFGRNLAKEYGVSADVIIAVPETSLPVAIGYSQESGIPYEMGLNKNRYIQRTFIHPDQKMREQGVKMKLSALPEVLKGKRVVVIDDSIVRGTTSRQVVNLIFEAGATEVHFLVSCPPIRFPDFYGIDIPNQKDLLAYNKDIEEMREYLGATSLHFLSFEGLMEATGYPANYFNASCFTGEYPIDIKERIHDLTPPLPLVELEKVAG